MFLDLHEKLRQLCKKSHIKIKFRCPYCRKGTSDFSIIVDLEYYAIIFLIGFLTGVTFLFLSNLHI